MEVIKPTEWVSKLPIEIIVRMGQRHGVDPFLLAAICMKESGGRRYAQRYEPGYRWLYKPDVFAKGLGCTLETEKIGQSTSYGLMQVMGAVFREYDFSGWFGQAFDCETNINCGARHLARFLKRYDAPLAIACYNAGSPVYIDDAKTLKNQAYVDDVLKLWNEARAGAKNNA